MNGEFANFIDLTRFIMTHKSILVLIMGSVFGTAIGQVPSIEWQDSFGGSSSDQGWSGIETSDGGFIVVGQASSINGDVSSNNGGQDYWVLKLNGDGSPSWDHAYGGSQNDVARSVKETSDNGFVVVGYSASNNGDVTENNGASDMWVVKLNAMGELQWQVSLGGSGNDFMIDIIETMDGGYLAVGNTDSDDGDVSTNLGGKDMWVVKLDANGDLVWETSVGGTLDDFGNAVIELSNGDLVVVGSTDSSDGDVGPGHHGLRDVWVVELSGSGVVLSSVPLGGTDNEYGTSIIQDGSGFIIAAHTASADGDVSEAFGATDLWLFRLDDQYAIDWERSFGGTDNDYSSDVADVEGGGFIVLGSSESVDGDLPGNNGSRDLWVLRVDQAGAPIWQMNYGGSGLEIGSSIEQTDDLGFFLLGSSASTDGDVEGNNGGNDYWVIKLSGTSGIGSEDVVEAVMLPNPSEGIVSVLNPLSEGRAELFVYDQAGRSVYQELVNGPKLNVDLSHLTSGTYRILIRSGRSLASGSVVIQ